MILRIDDIGASSKEFEVYSKKFFGLGNFLFLKYLPYFKAWGRYSELSLEEWESIYTLIERYDARLLIGITACWVDRESNLISFPKKFPDQAKFIKSKIESGLFKVALHGLTHCVVGNHRPRLFKSNRSFHREFWDYLPFELHYKNIKEGKKILEDWLKIDIDTLIPPGNVYSLKTVKAAHQNGIKYINANNDIIHDYDVKFIDSKNQICFHDREIKLYGYGWLKNLLEKNIENKYEFF